MVTWWMATTGNTSMFQWHRWWCCVRCWCLSGARWIICMFYVGGNIPLTMEIYGAFCAFELDLVPSSGKHQPTETVWESLVKWQINHVGLPRGFSLLGEGINIQLVRWDRTWWMCCVLPLGSICHGNEWEEEKQCQVFHDMSALTANLVTNLAFFPWYECVGLKVFSHFFLMLCFPKKYCSPPWCVVRGHFST